MTELQKELQALNVSISNDEVNAFRSCLCAMAARLQREEAAAALSLAEWWQWLDEEGYERELFATALRHICQSNLSGPAWTELQSVVHCMQARSEGLPELCQHVQERSKTLASTMEHLEACAQAEQHALEMTAGGMTRKGAEITFVSAYVGVKLIAAVSTGLIVGRSRRVEVRIEEPVLETVRQQEVAVQEKAVAVQEKTVAVEKREAEVIIHAELRTTQDVERVGVADLRASENSAKSNLLNKDYLAYNEAINAKFKAHVKSDDIRLKPLYFDSKGQEHYVLKFHERDMVKVIVKEQEFIFYKSTGLGGKSWETQKWYPINGIGKDGWFNKLDGAQNYFGVRKLKLVNEELFALSSRDSFKAAERHLVEVEAETEAIRQKLNEGMEFVTEYDDIPNFKKMRRETFTKVLPMMLKEQFPNLSIKPKWVERLAKRGEWHMRGLTEDHVALKEEFNMQNSELSGEVLRLNTQDFEDQIKAAKERLVELNLLSEKELAQAKSKLIKDTESAVANQITDEVAQLEKRAIDAVNQKVETVAATMRKEERLLITDTENRAEDLVRKGELVVEQEMVIVEESTITDVRLVEKSKLLL